MLQPSQNGSTQVTVTENIVLKIPNKHIVTLYPTIDFTIACRSWNVNLTLYNGLLDILVVWKIYCESRPVSSVNRLYSFSYSWLFS